MTEAIFELLAPRAEGKHLEFASIISPEVPFIVHGDDGRLRQVLVNLLLNAAVHTPPGTPIQINAEAGEKEITLTVADQGPGIPPEALPHLFDKFYRAPGAAAGGSGLGLSIVKGFVEAHGGTVSAQNRPGGGAEFTLRLPLKETPPAPEAAP